VGLAQPIESIHAFIGRELNRLESIQPKTSSLDATERLDEVFRAAIS